ncbi:MAG: hypothetical protein HYZ74_01975 [Elusimicrobia bacterium]|nr:hypothetical protein [Elusimicrobiota bacterium]
MTRRDLLVLSALAAAILAFLAPVWWRAPNFFNHGDLYTYHWPLRHHSTAALIEGRLPFWNPYVLLGVPHAANPQAVLFYPPAVLGFLLPIVTSLAWDQILHILWAATGAFLLARAFRASRAAAAALAAAFALSPFLAYRVASGIPTLVAALSWAPWAWLAWLAGATPLLAAVWALQFFSGHPQFLLINAVGMAIWAASRRRAAPWTRLVGGACGALALAAAQWLPTLEYLRGSNRSGWPAEFSGSYSLNPSALWMWLRPGVLGTPLAGDWKEPASVFYESGGMWLGNALLLAACWGLARGRARLGAVALAFGGLTLALGVNGPLGRLLVAPGLSYLRTPSRWSFLCLWGLWLLAAQGLGAVRSARQRAVLTLLPLAVVLELFLWDAAFLKHQDPRPFTAASAEVVSRLAGKATRVLTDPGLANPNKSIVYRMRNVNGYDAFYPAGVASWAAQAEGAPAADSSRVLVSRWRCVRDGPARRGRALLRGGALAGLARVVKRRAGPSRALGPGLPGRRVARARVADRRAL